MNPLDAVDACPLADSCESCGSNVDLDVATAETPVGVYCFTTCGACTEAGKAASPGGVISAIDRVCAHCEHLGIDVDRMDQLMEDERRRLQ